MTYLTAALVMVGFLPFLLFVVVVGNSVLY